MGHRWVEWTAALTKVNAHMTRTRWTARSEWEEIVMGAGTRFPCDDINNPKEAGNPL